MQTVLLIDGENFKGKIKEVFNSVGESHPVWHEYDFRGLLDRVLAGIKVDRSTLQPAVKEVKYRKVLCTYLGFEVNPNKGLSYTTNKTILIRNSEILAFKGA
jgi:hypothetical protein